MWLVSFVVEGDLWGALGSCYSGECSILFSYEAYFTYFTGLERKTVIAMIRWGSITVTYQGGSQGLMFLIKWSMLLRLSVE